MKKVTSIFIFNFSRISAESILIAIFTGIFIMGCNGKHKRGEILPDKEVIVPADYEKYEKDTNVSDGNTLKTQVLKTIVNVEDTLGLRIYYPHYSTIDLVCGEMPSKDDQNILMFAEAAFTGELLDEFVHSNIAGDHVSKGKREKGYRCKRNTGAFVFYDNTPKFLYKDYSDEFNLAANKGGCGFAQEMIIHNGELVPRTRPDGNVNEFRALSLINGKVAIADSKGSVKYKEFYEDLLKSGATEALYLDMGPGWNYSWYRDSNGNPIEIHPVPTKFATNWITFYK